jgi:lipopolysaccharide export system protein LptC
MQKNIKTLKTYSVIVVIFIATMFFYACKNDIEEIKSFSTLDTMASEVVKNARIIYSDSGELVAILKAPLLEHYNVQEPYIELKEGVAVYFYDSIGVISSTLTADYAISYEAEEKMEARKDVEMVNTKGEQINTEVLIWDQRTDRIYSNEFVKITTEDKIIFGEGFVSDERFDKWKIIKPRGTIYVEDQEAKSDSLNNID